MRWRLTVSGSLTTDYHQRLTAWNGIIILPPFCQLKSWKNVSWFLSKQMPLCVVFFSINVMMALPIITDGASACILLLHGGIFLLFFLSCSVSAIHTSGIVICSMPYMSLFLLCSCLIKWWGSSWNFLLLSPLVMIVGCPDVLLWWWLLAVQMVLIILVLGWSW